ncbi:hypothetical protein TruAng_005329 [Truncatella angustata]|nr:hypothetical protein TruAng_005329 [Truncatella angustata]
MDPTDMESPKSYQEFLSHVTVTQLEAPHEGGFALTTQAPGASECKFIFAIHPITGRANSAQIEVLADHNSNTWECPSRFLAKHGLEFLHDIKLNGDIKFSVRNRTGTVTSSEREA